MLLANVGNQYSCVAESQLVQLHPKHPYRHDMCVAFATTQQLSNFGPQCKKACLSSCSQKMVCMHTGGDWLPKNNKIEPEEITEKVGFLVAKHDNDEPRGNVVFFFW